MLLEREAELTTLRSIAHEVRQGRSRLVLVSGEAGIGKTTLLHGLANEVPADVRLVWGRCDDISSPSPLGPIREIARTWPSVLELLSRAEPPEAYAAWAAELGREPTVAVIEDVHWADDATIDMLTQLARRLGELGAAVLVSYRDDEVHAGHPLQRFLAAADRRLTMQLRLHPLSPVGVARLCEGTDWEPTVLYTATRGNPFFVTETVAMPPASDLPPTVSAAVLARILHLSPPARAALERVSVWPGLMDFTSLEALLGEDQAALEEAEDLGVVVVEPGGVRFRHEIARQATESALSGLRRRNLQRQVTRVLQDQGEAQLSRLVHHAQACGDVQSVVNSAPRAAELAARAGAHGQALELFRTALEYEHLLDPVVRARTLDGYAWELYNAYEFSAAVRHARRAAALFAEIGDSRGEALALVRCARHLFMSGEPDEALTAVRRAKGLTTDVDDPLTAETTTALGAMLALVDDPAEARCVLSTGRSQALRTGRGGLAALCLNYSALAEPNLTPADRIDLLHRSMAEAREAGAHEVVARGYTNLVEMMWRFGRYADVAETVPLGLAYTSERGFASHAFNLHVHRALLAARQGEWDAALTRLNPGHRPFESKDMLVVYNVPPYARLLTRRGDSSALELLQRVWQVALKQRLLLGFAFAGPALIESAWLNHEPHLARSVYRDWLPHRNRPCAGPVDAELCRYLVRCGIAPQEPPVLCDCDDGAEGWRLGLSGQWRAAADFWQRVGDPYEEALELAESGDPDSTLRAWQLLARLEARPAQELVRQRLRKLGVCSVPRGPTDRTRSNPAGLTARQLEVARLVADGLTNNEIATELVLSTRTVDHHVSSALTKLGVSTRRDLTRLVHSWEGS